MYFGLQDTKPPPCPLHLTKQGGSIHRSQLYLYTVYKLVLYILETITSLKLIINNYEIMTLAPRLHNTIICSLSFFANGRPYVDHPIHCTYCT
jgi:hypothetical protein